MSNTSYPQQRTALLFVDPYNDFLSEGGKLWPRLRDVAGEVGLLDNLRTIVGAVRSAGMQVFVVPHHRAEPDDFATWQRATPYQRGAAKAQVFAKGSWGGEWHPDFAPRPEDIVIKEHWSASGFANTNLDVQLKQHDISHLVLVGMIANTCIECTGRFASELGYHVTLVSDATAAFTKEAMHAAHALNGPTFAHAILTTRELVEALPKG